MAVSLISTRLGLSSAGSSENNQSDKPSPPILVIIPILRLKNDLDLLRVRTDFDLLSQNPEVV